MATLGERGAFVLIGFMGAGKTTVARELAAALGARLIDSDQLLEERLGCSIAEAFERPAVAGAVARATPASGSPPRSAAEAEFRAAEEELVCELLARAGGGEVIALGGGSVLSERVRASLQGHVVILLDVDPELAWRRVRASESGAERPLARDRDTFFALHAERRELYEELADAYLPPLAMGEGSRALGALGALAQSPSGTRMVWAVSASGQYPVLVGPGLLVGVDFAGLQRAWQLPHTPSRSFCVTDETVASLYAQRLGEVAGTAAIPAGERHKTLASAERVWQVLVDCGVTRADHLVALGGGVVGDLAGFCAATYQRGVAVVHVPTTLVAQVDSAYGGKTGVDLPQAKNYVGAYHQPAGVLVDPSLLDTLPAAELAAGWVEVLKTALIAGGRLWEHVSRGGEADERTILACARAKLAIVACDERDEGRRRVLNLGHTVGHAIEAATGYDAYRHGEAVGLGLLAALRLSGREDLRDTVRGLLAARGLPTMLEQASAGDVLEALMRDKKRLHDAVPFVLVRAPGDVAVEAEVAAKDVEGAVAELMR